MNGSTFGNIFRITTWGESHGKAIGVVIDGCPAGLPAGVCGPAGFPAGVLCGPAWCIPGAPALL